MDNALFVGLSKQITLRKELDVVANNIANADTAGFKVESLMTANDPQTPWGATHSRQIQFVVDNGLARDFAQGALRQTGGTFDLGLRGDGFFQVQTSGAPSYTRDGRFGIDAQGQLVTAQGDPVLSDGGSPIVIDPTKPAPVIGEDGTVAQGLQVVGKIGVVRFASLSALQKQGGGYYQNVSNIGPQPATDTKIQQGMIEDSNVNPITQITRLIEVSRAYQQVANLMDTSGSVYDEAIQRLGKVN
ncbi:MAG TPA: flagellar basal-body rod protein FlgF [Caulobacteraceae bacterium]|nr:flagellar basal-body rod protein FlgF [Caulobacteraceae bacterium]